jgi:hypothetical protein
LFFYFGLLHEKLRCNRADFVSASRAEGATCAAGYITVPVYRLPYF